MKIHNIYVKEIGNTGRFAARLGALDGELIVATSRQPLFDAARVLKDRSGPEDWLEMWGDTPPKLHMSGRIDVLATKTVREDRKRGPDIHSWKAFSPAAVRSPAAGKSSG
jgi:hypothetical protein